MHLKEVVFEDYSNYYKPAMFLGVCKCDWKCQRGDPTCHCQNLPLAQVPDIEIADTELISRYLANPLTHAVVIGGLEPFLQFNEVLDFVKTFRIYSQDDIVIYSGYRPEEIEEPVNQLKVYSNIIIKYGRYRSGKPTHLDQLLGVELANSEQYAVKIS